MFRLILTLLNPYKNGLSQKKTSFWIRLRMWVFGACVRMLKNFYRRYAYSDVIMLGDTEITLSRRDHEFEQWLSQLKLNVQPRLQTSTRKPVNKKEHWWRPFYKFFRMEQITMIAHDKKKIIFDRTRDLTITSDMEGQLKLSDDNDTIQHSEYKVVIPDRKKLFEKEKDIAEETLPSEDKTEPETKPVTLNPRANKNKVTLGEIGPVALPRKESDIETNKTDTINPEPVIIKVPEGEIDESF